MRISNPRTFAGDLPLATREFVNVSVSNLSGELYNYIDTADTNISSYINTVSGNIHTYIDTQDGTLSGALIASHKELSTAIVTGDDKLYSDLTLSATTLTTEISALNDYVIESDNQLDEKIDDNRSEVIKWFVGEKKQTENPEIVPYTHGYAWLDSKGTIDPSLMPPISLINVITINQFKFLTELGLSVNWSAEKIQEYLDNEFGLIEQWLKLGQEINDEYVYNHDVQTGDMIIVTYNNNKDIDRASLTYDEYEFYSVNISKVNTNEGAAESAWEKYETAISALTTDEEKDAYFADWVTTWYFINNDYVGQYIVTKGNQDESESDGESGNTIDGKPYAGEPQVQKLTVPDGIVRTICGIAPNASDGDVKLRLQDVLYTTAETVGQQRADYIMRIIPGGKPFVNFLGDTVPHFALKPTVGSDRTEIYARYDELSAFWDRFEKDENVLSTTIDTHYAELVTASGALQADVDYISGIVTGNYAELVAASGALQADVNFLSGSVDTVSGIVTGNYAELVAASGALQTDVNFLSGTFGEAAGTTVAAGIPNEAITQPVFDQLRRIYNDMNDMSWDTAFISGKVNFLHETLNNKAAGIQCLTFDWNADAGQITGFIYEPSKETVTLNFQMTRITNQQINDGEKVGGITSYGQIQVDSIPMSDEGINGDSDFNVYSLKILGSKQIIACYYNTNTGENETGKDNWYLATPDITFVDRSNSPGESSFTVISFIDSRYRKNSDDEVSGSDLAPSCPKWKLYLVDNILTDVTTANGGISDGGNYTWGAIEDKFEDNVNKPF